MALASPRQAIVSTQASRVLIVVHWFSQFNPIFRLISGHPEPNTAALVQL
jgi:hypothetical protein